jgi:hypothetical protein
MKNCPLDSVIRVLGEEIAAAESAMAKAGFSEDSKAAARAAADAAASAKETMVAVKEMVRRHSRTFSAGDFGEVFTGDAISGDIIQLNIGGDWVDILKDTLLMAPADSMLRNMFSSDWTGPRLQTDNTGRIFLNFPPASFKRIVNHLRLIHATHPDDFISPLVVPRQYQEEVEELAWLLGIGDLVSQPQFGRGVGMPRRLGPRPQVAVTDECGSWFGKLFIRRQYEVPPQQPTRNIKKSLPLALEVAI